MDKKMSHEPGPWILGGCSWRMITTPDGYVGVGFIADVDTLANARLICAAPDLLEALEDLLIRVADDEEYGPEHAITKARAAIAKARGES